MTSENIVKWMLTLDSEKQRVAWLRAICEEDRQESLKMLVRHKGVTNKQAKVWDKFYKRGIATLSFQT